MAEQDKDRDTKVESLMESLRDTGVQSGETGGPDADTAAAPDFSFVSGATGAAGGQDAEDASDRTPSDAGKDRVRRGPKGPNA